MTEITETTLRKATTRMLFHLNGGRNGHSMVRECVEYPRFTLGYTGSGTKGYRRWWRVDGIDVPYGDVPALLARLNAPPADGGDPLTAQAGCGSEAVGAITGAGGTARGNMGSGMPRNGAYTLADLAPDLTHLEITCSRCPRKGRYRVAGLVDRHGRDTTLPTVARLIVEASGCANKDRWDGRCDAWFANIRFRPGVTAA